MRILIIGSGGFIGSHCKSFFSQKGHVVFTCDITGTPSDSHFIINADAPDFYQAFHASRPDVCINAAGSADVALSITDPEKDFFLNVSLVELILKAIDLNNTSCKLLNFSSAAVYGNPPSLPVAEDVPLNPVSFYGKNKLLSEELLKTSYVTKGLSSLSMRVFSAFGAGLKKQLFWDVYQRSLQGKEVVLSGTGKESRDFIYIEDLLRVMDVLINKGTFDGRSVNVASGVETEICYAANALLSLLKRDNTLSFSGLKRPGDPLNWRADISSLKQMGFAPFVTFDEGIKKYVQWLRELKLE